MQPLLRTCATLAAACAALAITNPASALHKSDHKSEEAWKVRLSAEAPNGAGAPNSDIAFRRKAYVGNYDGFRIFDISTPTPALISDFRRFGPQNDLTVYDRKGDGGANLLITSSQPPPVSLPCWARWTLSDSATGNSLKRPR